MDIPRLKAIARELRVDVIRMLAEAGSGHPGGSLSAADIVTVLFFHKMRHRPAEPDWPDRDRFVLSKGHCVPVLYAALAKTGYFPSEELFTLRKLNSRLQGHPDRVRLPYIEAATGSLGQGLSLALGMALALRLDKRPSRVYCMISDGESESGQVWEAALAAPKYKADNLTVILDYNKVQLSGHVKNIMDLDPLPEKWRAFRWHVLEIDGHDMAAIGDAFREAEATTGRPTMIVAHTVKGKGVSFMEDKWEWHGKAPNREEAERAVQELLAHPV